MEETDNLSNEQGQQQGTITNITVNPVMTNTLTDGDETVANDNADNNTVETNDTINSNPIAGSISNSESEAEIRDNTNTNEVGGSNNEVDENND